MVVSALGALGDAEGAREAAGITLERAEKAVAVDRSNGHAMAQVVIALAALGQRERARQWIDRALLLEPDNVLMRYNFACALSLYLADVDGALELLGAVFASNRAADHVKHARADPDFDSIRGDARFQAMVAAAEARLAAAKPAEAEGAPESA